MTKKELENIGKEFARAMDQVILRGFKVEPKDAISMFDKIGSSFLQRVSGHIAMQLELKRRIAENKFTIFSERNRPFKEVTSFYGAICELGFTDLYKKATIDINFSRYCLRNNKPNKAAKILRNLKIELSNSIAAYRYLTQNVEKILLTIEKANKRKGEKVTRVK